MVFVALTVAALSFISPGAIPVLRSNAPAPLRLPAAAGPQMIIGGGVGRSIFRAVKSVPNNLGRRGGNGCMDGGDGGDGGDGTAEVPAGDSGDESSSNPLVGAWNTYNELLDSKPLIMKMLTSMTGFMLGDILAQVFISKGDFDAFRLFRLTSFGFLVHGSTSHFFYNFLDGKIPGTGAVQVFSKVFIDQVLWNPIFGIMFFGYVAAFELKGLGFVKNKIENELLTQVTGSWKVWPLAHAINFRFIPSSQRVLYINSIQIGYNCFLSLIANR